MQPSSSQPEAFKQGQAVIMEAGDDRLLGVVQSFREDGWVLVKWDRHQSCVHPTWITDARRYLNAHR